MILIFKVNGNVAELNIQPALNSVLLPRHTEGGGGGNEDGAGSSQPPAETVANMTPDTTNPANPPSDMA